MLTEYLLYIISNPALGLGVRAKGRLISAIQVHNGHVEGAAEFLDSMIKRGLVQIVDETFVELGFLEDPGSALGFELILEYLRAEPRTLEKVIKSMPLLEEIQVLKLLYFGVATHVIKVTQKLGVIYYETEFSSKCLETLLDKGVPYPDFVCYFDFLSSQKRIDIATLVELNWKIRNQGGISREYLKLLPRLRLSK